MEMDMEPADNMLRMEPADSMMGMATVNVSRTDIKDSLLKMDPMDSVLRKANNTQCTF
jgi:hypothetical protein